jgi:hypothetical protein
LGKGTRANQPPRPLFQVAPFKRFLESISNNFVEASAKLLKAPDIFGTFWGELCSSPASAARFGVNQLNAQAFLALVDSVPGPAIGDPQAFGGGTDGAGLVNGLQQGDTPPAQNYLAVLFYPEVGFDLHTVGKVLTLDINEIAQTGLINEVFGQPRGDSLKAGNIGYLVQDVTRVA